MDVLTLTKLSSEGNAPNENGKIGLWRVILVKNLPYTDMRKTGKVPKFLSHQLFPSARYLCNERIEGKFSDILYNSQQMVLVSEKLDT